ncbi:MAG: accessory gene regulator B family protein [Elusimicrobia bacterium]|nr:accessory gene regulator B family protein [Elusimicrobiota bacterium]
MFKDYDKYLRASLKVYLFVLVLVFIMKMVGLDYFGLDLNNKIFNYINSNFLNNKITLSIYNITLIMIYQYIMISIICKNNTTKIRLINIYTFPFTLTIQLLKSLLIGSVFSLILELTYLYVLFIIINNLTSKLKLKFFNKKFLIVIILNFIFQFISSISRYKYSITCINNQVADMLLNLDYMFMMLILHKLYFEKGEILCTYQVEVGSFSQTKANLLKLPKRLQRNLHNFKALDKETKLTYIIYFILSLIWNTLTIVIILLFAKLNGTIIECLFILTSFWLSKRVFGKPFHLPSMKQCFIVSNLTYYILNRITTPLGISILIPIMLGVGLSYITSKLVKKTYKPLYKGMPKEKFEESILKVAEKDSIRYKVCYDFFINKENAIYLASKYNYTEAGIRQIIYMVKKEIKA